MGRITSHSADRPESYVEPDFLETAGRLREPHVREQTHPARDAEIDARVLDRQEAEDYSWREPTNLDAPPPRPGYAQKWVRVAFRSEGDNINWNNRFRQGWTPRDPNTIPECANHYTIQPHQKHNVVMVGGSVLCEMPVQKLQARKRWLENENNNLELSITAETDKMNKDARAAGVAPIVREDKVSVTTGGRRRPATMAD